jgi:hypothetical protein
MAKGDDIIQQYYDYLCSRNEQPDMTFEDFKVICQTPFIHLRRQMSDDVLPLIRFTYLGSFMVLPGMIIKMAGYNQMRFEKNLITEKQYTRYMNLLFSYVKANKEHFKKHMDKLQQWKDYL